MPDRCLSCGAILPEGAKLCTNCGKIVSKSFRPVSEQVQVRKPSPTVQTDARIFEHKPTPTAVTEKIEVQETAGERDSASHTQHWEHHARKPVRRKKKKNTRLKVLAAAVIVAAVVCVSFLTVIRALRIREIKKTKPVIETSAKMSFDNFGEAAENFFDEPDWEYSFFTNTVTVSGENKGTEYEFVFKPNDEQVVSSVRVGKDEFDDKKEIDILVMRMFM